MPYFFIFPLFALWLLLGIASSIALRFTRLQHLAPYAWAITLGSLLGCMAGNAVLLLLTGLAVHAPVPEVAREARGIGVAAAIFLGPFAASALGALTGAGAGPLLLYVLRRKTA